MVAIRIPPELGFMIDLTTRLAVVFTTFASLGTLAIAAAAATR